MSNNKHSASVTEFIAAVMDMREEAVNSDVNMAQDRMKYSGWLAAISTGGVALVLSNYPKIVDGSWLIRPFAIGIILVGASLQFIGILLSALLNWQVNRWLSLQRQRNTYFRKQHLILMAQPPTETDLIKLGKAILAGRWLSHEDRNRLARHRKRERELMSSSKLLVVQQTLTCAGYLLMFVVAVPLP